MNTVFYLQVHVGETDYSILLAQHSGKDCSRENVRFCLKQSSYTYQWNRGLFCFVFFLFESQPINISFAEHI